MCKSHTKKIGALKLSQQDVGKNCIFRGCEFFGQNLFLVFLFCLSFLSFFSVFFGCCLLCFDFFTAMADTPPQSSSPPQVCFLVLVCWLCWLGWVFVGWLCWFSKSHSISQGSNKDWEAFLLRLEAKGYTFEQIQDTPDDDIPGLLNQLGYKKDNILVRSSIRTTFNRSRQTTTSPPGLLLLLLL